LIRKEACNYRLRVIPHATMDSSPVHEANVFTYGFTNRYQAYISLLEISRSVKFFI